VTKAVTGGRVRLATVAAGVELVTLVIPAAMTSATITPGWAQDISINFGQGGGLADRVLQLVALMTVLSLAPSILVMVTSFTRAFEIGFLLFLPFLVIDLAVASVLMSMGTMMLPPVVVSLPFKLIFFVLVDGWSLAAGSLVQSYGP
jgi:flagellar biosynthesis protein FliP